jgi:hypothetical protein
VDFHHLSFAGLPAHSEFDQLRVEHDLNRPLAVVIIADMDHEVWLRGGGGGIDLGECQLRWFRLSEQIFRVDKWSLCRG